jgi:chromosomal replication initiator protein
MKPIELPSSMRTGHRPTLQIQELVALSYGLHPKIMTARWRGQRHVSWARMIAMYLTRQITHRSTPAIGRAFGGRDHSTVIHAIRSVERKMFTDPIVWADVQALQRVLEG